jgi:hypothetical protein
MYSSLGWKSEWEKTTVRFVRRLEDNIKINLTQTGCGVDSSGTEHRPVAGCCKLVMEYWVL